MSSKRRPCGCPVDDRHNWNCPLTPIYMQAYWDADPTPVIRRHRQYPNVYPIAAVDETRPDA